MNTSHANGQPERLSVGLLQSALAGLFEKNAAARTPPAVFQDLSPLPGAAVRTLLVTRNRTTLVEVIRAAGIEDVDADMRQLSIDGVPVGDRALGTVLFSGQVVVYDPLPID